MNERSKTRIKNIIRKLGIEVRKLDNRLISLKPEIKPIGNVLISHTLNPFLKKDGEPFDNRHACDWECYTIAKTFLDLGYCVDVIIYYNHDFIPKKDYSFFIDVSSNMGRLAPLLNRDCIKIFHAMFAHNFFHNNAQLNRIKKLQQRKGITLSTNRLLTPNLSAELADYITLKGNDFTCKTYVHTQKPIFRIHTSATVLYPWPENKDFAKCRNHFLWLGGGALVHKGLDLVLDAFAELPDHQLTICGPINGNNVNSNSVYKTEADFEKAYHKELYETPNIHTIGWVGTDSPEFLEIAEKSVGLIYPSCSEAQSGSVLTCLHAGLIPIISYESGVDVDDFGVILKECSIDEIKNSILRISNIPAEELKLMARKAWEFVRTNHTRERFAEEYKKAIGKIMANHKISLNPPHSLSKGGNEGDLKGDEETLL